MTTHAWQVGIGMVEAIATALSEVGGSHTTMAQAVKAIEAGDPAYELAKLTARAEKIRKDQPVAPILETMILPTAKALAELTGGDFTVNWAWSWLVSEGETRLEQCTRAANAHLPAPPPRRPAPASARSRA